MELKAAAWKSAVSWLMFWYNQINNQRFFSRDNGRAYREIFNGDHVSNEEKHVWFAASERNRDQRVEIINTGSHDINCKNNHESNSMSTVVIISFHLPNDDSSIVSDPGTKPGSKEILIDEMPELINNK